MEESEKGNRRDEAQTALMSRHYVTSGELIIPQSPKRRQWLSRTGQITRVSYPAGVSGHAIR